MFKPGENSSHCEAPEGLLITGGTSGTGKIIWDTGNNRFDLGSPIKIGGTLLTNAIDVVSGVLSIGASASSISMGAPPSGYGVVPVGAILATMPHMAGAYNCTATTAADGNGFVVCGGQTIADANSPMNGQVVPNINDDVFLSGSAGTSGVAGGSNIKDLSHTHSVTSNVSVSAHASHTHQVTSNVAVSDHAAHTHSVTSNVSVADHAAHTHSVTSNVAVANHTLDNNNLPSHTHAIDHNHNSFSSTAADIVHSHTITSVTVASSGHKHVMPFGWGGPSNEFRAHNSFGTHPENRTHQVSATSVTTSGAISWLYTDAPSATTATPSATANGNSSHAHGVDVPAYSGSSGSAGAGTAVTHSVTNNSVNSGNPSATLTHSVTNSAVASGNPSATLSHAVGNGTVTSGSESASLTHSVTNSAVTSGPSLSSSYDVRPKYITCKYVMRIV